MTPILESAERSDGQNDFPESCCGGITALILQNRPQLLCKWRSFFSEGPHHFQIEVARYSVVLKTVAEMLEGLDLDFLPDALRRSVPRRQVAFVAGRLCAERALGELGSFDYRIQRQRYGAPAWPTGILGSITHTADLSYVAVCRGFGLWGIGIDSERIVSSSSRKEIADICFTEFERRALTNQKDRNLCATLIFSAKESYFKAIYSTVQRIVEFDEVEVTEIDWMRQKFSISPIAGSLLDNGVVPTNGQFQVAEYTVHTSIVATRKDQGGSLKRVVENEQIKLHQ